MESLPIAPHRRNHSSATNVFSSSASSSLKNPYEDVLFSKGGSTKKPFGAQEYTEIFSGSSSIPVLDLSSLEDRVGLGDCRNSTKVDYNNIFGGLKNDDVAVPYEKLFNASAKTAKQRISADDQSPSQESGSLHYTGRTKRSSGEASDQSIDGVKQQFNLSFNKTSQNNDDASNGKTHIAQFHAVPGFTYFVDGIPQLQKKTEGDRHVHSLKRDVSRTWSFSTEVDTFNRGKGGLIRDELDTPEKLNNVNEFNLKSQPSKVQSLERPSHVTNKADPRISKVSGVASREHASGKTDGEYLPLHLDEELDENSVAAVSAAALKKAMEQAQESIRLAKMIMERKREGLRDGTKTRSKSSSKVKDKKKTRIDRAAVNCSEGKISTGDFEKNNLTLTGVDGKFAQSVSHSDPLIIVGSAEVETAMENVKASKEHREEFIGVDTEFVQKEILSFSEKVGPQKQEEKVEARKEATKVPGSHVESRDPNLMSRLVENINLMLFRNKRTSDVEKMETGDEKMEQIEKTLHHEKEPEGVAALRNSNKKPEMDRSVVDNLDHSEGPENVTEVVARDHTSLLSHDQVKIVEEECEILRTGQEDQVMEENEHAGDDKEDLNNKFQQNEETVNQEEMMVSRSEIHNLMNGSRVEQEEIKHKTVYVDECNKNDQTHGGSFDMEKNVMSQKEAHKYFESGEQLKEDMKEDLFKRESEIFPEIEKVEMKDNWAHGPEIDKEKSHILDGDRQNFPGYVEQIDERYVNNFSFKGTETIEMEADTRPEVQKTDVMQDEEMNNSHREEGTGEENQSQHEFQKAVYDKDIDEAVDASSSNVSSIFSENHLKDISTIFCETQESSDFDLNDRTEEDQKTYISYKENVTMPKVPETFSGLDETTEMPVPHDWCLSDSEENVDGRNLQKTGEGPSSENLKEYFGSLKEDTEDILPKDHHTFETSGEIHDDGGACASEPQKQTLPELHFSDNKTAEIDLTYARHVFEQTLGSDGESVSTSSVDSIEGLLVHESQECTVIPKDETLNKDEIKAGVGMIINERKHGEERSDAVYSELDSEPKDTEKSMECERDEVTGQNIEKNEENPTGTSSREQKDAKENVIFYDKDDHQQRIEAIKKGREREKDRIAVERAIREARERAFADARERAERAAVVRAAAEARLRAMAEAREKFEKASMAAKQPVDSASTEAKIRAERAAVERATAEARERALEKARSQKTSTEARTQTDRSTTEKFTSSSRNNGLKHSFSSSDLEGVDGNAESAQRRKARLERHQRILERAANALAEKNMRDLIAQKEQAERNRLAESLDADIKRWAMGKEGNLRALLSTLQYILGPNGGWQPISLTEIITAAAVKKAYRKATLYVHPDKLQQRGASIQQKYICEKVFDMLKAAWNRFNSEER